MSDMHTCPRCQIGHLHPTMATYSRVIGSTLFCAQNVRAWRCDICGLQEFDDRALIQFDAMLGSADLPAEALRGGIKLPPVETEYEYPNDGKNAPLKSGR